MRVFFGWVFLVFLVGCATKRMPESHYEHEASDDQSGGLGARGVGAGGGGRAYGSAAAAPSAAPPSRSRAPSRKSSSVTRSESIVHKQLEKAAKTSVPDDGKQARMVHYNGYLKLKVSRPAETIEAVVAHAKEIGGFVEQQTRTTASLRVPVAKFRETYEWVIGQGDVIGRSMSARDVTNAHFALDLRLRTARKTRDRLQQLLARAEDENAKLALLKQIQRLTEQVDMMERQLKTLVRLASMSRLTVETESNAVMAGAKKVVPVAGFGWISGLSPFSRAVAQRGKLYKLPTPEGLVALSDKDHFQAESADGAIFWTARLENRPEGSAEFWIAAIQERIGKQFSVAEAGKIGDYLTLRLVAPSDEPYTYTLAIKVDGDELYLVEILYPSAEAEKRHRTHIEAVMGGGAS